MAKIKITTLNSGKDAKIWIIHICICGGNRNCSGSLGFVFVHLCMHLAHNPTVILPGIHDKGWMFGFIQENLYKCFGTDSNVVAKFRINSEDLQQVNDWGQSE